MNETIQIICETDFKGKAAKAAKKDKRSLSSYGYIAIQEKMDREEKKEK